MDVGDRGPSGSAAGSLWRIWGKLRRPLDPYGAAEALLGLTGRQAKQFVSTMIAASDEATALIDVMPTLIRSLSISTIVVPERTRGSVRGPILWSETMSARAGSAGDTALFVCATSNRAYDTDENRVLVLALSAIGRGGRDVEFLHRHGDTDEARFQIARHNGHAAARYLEHRALSSVTEIRQPGRSLQRVRNSRRPNYGPALAMVQKVSEPLSVDDLRSFCDAHTTAQHDLLAAVLDQLRSYNVAVGAMSAVDGELRSGALRYRHERCHRGTGRGGVYLGTTHLDVPTTAEVGPYTAGRSFEVRGRGDISAAVQHAIATGEI